MSTVHCPGCHSGLANATKTNSPANQTRAVAPIHRPAPITKWRNTNHCQISSDKTTAAGTSSHGDHGSSPAPVNTRIAPVDQAINAPSAGVQCRQHQGCAESRCPIASRAGHHHVPIVTPPRCQATGPNGIDSAARGPFGYSGRTTSSSGRRGVSGTCSALVAAQPIRRISCG